ncbi:MAG: zinc-binding dehydrogenase [Phycisphaerae bacterium]|nr:zinc-binding dehydrogenase [Phycisphaerae bacterium]
MDKFKKYSTSTEIDSPSTMQAIIAKGKGFENLEVAQVPVPAINPNQLLARVDAAGVCTSILKLIDQGPDHTFIRGWDMEKNPIILGDEGSVTLVKIGDNLKNKYRPGQRFAIQPAVDSDPINHRERYRDVENMHKCAVGYTLGGHLAQYIVVQEEVLKADCMLPLPNDSMSYFAVSMAEPISCIYSAQQRNYHIIKKGPHAERKPQLGMLSGGVAVVIGAGAMGRMHAELALRFNPRVLIVSDLQQERLDRTILNIGQKAKANNCKLICVLSNKLDETVKKESNGRGADDMILAVGINPVQQHALSLLAAGGVANLFGGLPKGKHILQLDAIAVHYQEIKIVGSSGGEPSDMSATLKAIANNDVDPGNYIAAIGSLDNAIDVLKLIRETKIDGKAILYPHVKKTPLQIIDYWDKDKEIEFLNDRLA